MTAATRWTLTAEFDSMAELRAVGSDSEADYPLGEAAGFYEWMRQYWSVGIDTPEDELVWEGETVTCHCDLLDHLIEPIGWLTMRVVPVRIEVKRNEPRGV